jgi:hypothetical protein
MTVQARLSEADMRLYNVNRDIAHNFGDVVREVAARLEDERWDALAAYLREHEITMDQLGEACAAFCKFVGGACDDPKENMEQVLRRCGWFDVPEEAQIALMAVLGTVLSGYFFAGVRDAAVAEDGGPSVKLRDLREAGRRAHEALTPSRLKRWWVRCKRRIAGLFNGGNDSD